MDAKGEVLLTIMASLAQQESQSLSQNVKLGIQYRFQQGKVMVNASRFLGYIKDQDGNLIIEPEQAEVVKRIYRQYLEGSSMEKISKSLMADGILTGAGKEKWHTSTINKILRNEKYIGDALLQKTYTTDFLNKTRVKNNGTMPQYYVEDNHQAIIPRELFMLVQEELVKRRVVHTSSNGKKRSFSSNHCFSQIVYCGECGEIFRRIHWNNRGKKSVVCRCLSRLESTGIKDPCHARTVNELLLEEIALKAINQTLSNKNDFIQTLQQNIIQTVKQSNTSSLEGIEQRLNELQEQLIQKANNRAAYDEIADEIFSLRELKSKAESDTVTRNEQINRINDLQEFINEQGADIEVFDEKLVRRLIEKITVFDDWFVVEFKSGVEVRVEG